MEIINKIHRDFERFYEVKCRKCGSVCRYSFDEYWDMVKNGSNEDFHCPVCNHSGGTIQIMSTIVDIPVTDMKAKKKNHSTSIK